jgi:crossover junction endodeoxyribonuclease RuvC
MRILGVDPGLNITGYGLINSQHGSLRLIEAGIIRTKASDDISRRLNKIYQGMLKLVKERRPEVLVLEKLYAHWRHPTTAYILGQARGVICLVCAQMNIELSEYGATRINKAIIGRGNAAKHQIQMMVASVLGISSLIEPPDVADALALAIAHAHISKIKLPEQ